MATNPTGFSMLQRSGDQNQLDSQAQQQMIAMLLKNAVAAPQKPELSWTQGLARMLEAGVSAYKQKQLNDKNSQVQQTRGSDAKILGMALASNDPAQIAKAMQQMKDPQSQSMALNALANAQNANQTRQLEMAKIDRQGQNQKDVAHIRTDTPDNVAKQQNANLTQYQAALQNQIGQETDPQKKAQLQETLASVKKNQSLLLNQTRSNKGDLPDVIGADKNSYIQKLDQGIQPLPGEVQAYQHGKMTEGPERKFQEKIGEKSADTINKAGDSISQEAASLQEATRLGDKIQQEFAMNPNLTSGPGTETQTKLVSFLNKVMPGLVSSNEDQQAVQKDIGGFVLAGGQKLHAAGVQRLTQMELQLIVPMFEPTLMNTKAGLKTIFEATSAMNPVIQEGAKKMQDLYAAYNKNPNFNIGRAQAELQQTISSELSNSTLNYFNSKLAPSGQQIMVNPDYDPVKNPINKYVKVKMDENGNPVAVAQGGLSAQDIGADPRLLTPALGQGNPGDQFKSIDGQNPQDQTKQNPVAQTQNAPQIPSTQPQQTQTLPPQAQNIQQPQQPPAPDVKQPQTSGQPMPLPPSGNSLPPMQDLSQKPDAGAQPPSSQNISYQQPDPSQSMLAPQMSQQSMSQLPVDPQQMLAMALAKKQQNPQDYASMFTNSPDMSF